MKSFPFSERNTIPEKDIYAYNQELVLYEDLMRQYNKKISKEATTIKNQFMFIEQEMLNSFQYVHPTVTNIQTTSVIFATIIRESSNLFEIIARDLYAKLFTYSNDYNINIKNFLTLDIFLNLSESTLSSPTLQDEFSESNLLQPFKSLLNWDRNSEISSNHIPQWWTAYNKLKHDVDGFNYATFENALLSLGAIYLTIGRVYGEGVVSGILEKPLYANAIGSGYAQQLVPVSRLFIEETEFKTIGVFG